MKLQSILGPFISRATRWRLRCRQLSSETFCHLWIFIIGLFCRWIAKTNGIFALWREYIMIWLGLHVAGISPNYGRAHVAVSKCQEATSVNCTDLTTDRNNTNQTETLPADKLSDFQPWSRQSTHERLHWTRWIAGLLFPLPLPPPPPTPPPHKKTVTAPN